MAISFHAFIGFLIALMIFFFIAYLFQERYKQRERQDNISMADRGIRMKEREIIHDHIRHGGALPHRRDNKDYNKIEDLHDRIYM